MLRAIGGDFRFGSEFVRRICTSIGSRRIGGGGLIISARGIGGGIFGGSGASRIGGGGFGRGTWSRPAFGGAFLATIGAALNGTWSRPAGGGGLPLGSGLGWEGKPGWLSLAEYLTL